MSESCVDGSSGGWGSTKSSCSTLKKNCLDSWKCWLFEHLFSYAVTRCVCGHESWRSRCCSKCSSLVTTSSLTDKSSSSPSSPMPLPTGSPSYLDVSTLNIIQVGCFNYRAAISGLFGNFLFDNCIRQLVSLLFNFLLLSFWKRKDKKTTRELYISLVVLFKNNPCNQGNHSVFTVELPLSL